jgi:hypothetical protein
MEGEPPEPPLPQEAVASQLGVSAEQPLAPTAKDAAKTMAAERSERFWKPKEK